jgi:hypothetical protein
MKVKMTFTDKVDCTIFGNLVGLRRQGTEKAFVEAKFETGVIMILPLTHFMKCYVTMTERGRERMKQNIHEYLTEVEDGKATFIPTDDDLEFARQFL